MESDKSQVNTEDFTAELRFLPTSEGGRHTPAKAGYRSQILFPFSAHQTSGQQTYLGCDLVLPGEMVIASIIMASPNLFYGKLETGQKFQFLEGSNLIGTGVITSISNILLKCASS